ncbi:SDR family oxidoreductase [Chitinophagaceae bacterium MMS25-I14]
MSKYAVITGATQGIGLAIAERLLEEGFSVAVCARSSEDLAILERAWQQRYPNAAIICFSADFARKEDVAAFASVVLKTFPLINILVNNAGIFIPGQLADEADGHLETLMSVNLYSAYHLTRLLLPQMKMQQSGHIFNMCSVASLKAYPNGGSYSITKYALMGFSENLREELKPDGIKVTALCPGATNSRSWAGSGISESRIMEAADVAKILWAAYTLSAQADVETIVMRPLLGDL